MQNQAALRINSATAKQFNIEAGGKARVQQSHGQALTLPVVIDDKVADNCVFIPTGLPETALLGEAFGSINIMRA
jgi:NADH-quinone oxidoreductase subunit G